MILLLGIVLSVALLMLFAYQRASLSVFSIGFLLFLFVFSECAELSGISKTMVWIIALPVFTILNIPFLRRHILTRWILAYYQRVKPTLSSTEAAALTVGTVGWEGELLSGMPNWQIFNAYSAPALTPEEQAFLNGSVEQLCRMLNTWDINHQYHDLPPEVWTFLKDQGFFGLIIPKSYGGKQFSAFAHSEILAKIASCCNVAATIVGVPNSLGPAELLLEYGTSEQKDHYLPRLASGQDIPCFALTSPVAGSDAGAMTDTGVVCRDLWQGQETLGIRLNWNKRYITLAPVATLLGLAVKLYDPDQLLGKQTDYGITCLLVPTDLPGIRIGRRHLPLYSAFPNGPTQGEGVFVPLDAIIGGVEMAGKGWQMLMECLAVGRGVTLPALSVGGAKMTTFASGIYARIREQFHLPIGRFAGVAEALAKIAGNTYTMDALRLFVVSALDAKERPATPSAMSKYHATELARHVICDAMDIHGGKGICLGPKNYLAQSYLETPISITVEGANIVTRCLMIFGQGVMRCHPYLLPELQAAGLPDPQHALREFDQLFFQHVGFLCSNFARTCVLGITRGKGLGVIPPKLTPSERRYYRQLNRFSAAFALLADTCMIALGSGFKRKESISGRLADVWSMLYLLSAVLKRFQNQGRLEEDIPLLHFAGDTLLYRLHTAIEGILQNLQPLWLSGMLRISIFPWGSKPALPSDTCHETIAQSLQKLCGMRSRLIEGIYQADEGITSELQSALEAVILATESRKKLQVAIQRGDITEVDLTAQLAQAEALQILTKDEVALIQAAQKASQIVIAVDDFV